MRTILLVLANATLTCAATLTVTAGTARIDGMAPPPPFSTMSVSGDNFGLGMHYFGHLSTARCFSSPVDSWCTPGNLYGITQGISPYNQLTVGFVVNGTQVLNPVGLLWFTPASQFTLVEGQLDYTVRFSLSGSMIDNLGQGQVFDFIGYGTLTSHFRWVPSFPLSPGFTPAGFQAIGFDYLFETPEPLSGTMMLVGLIALHLVRLKRGVRR